MKKLFNYLIPIVVLTNISLMYQINKLPSKITEAMNLPAKDTITVKVGDKLIKQHGMVYFEGKTIRDGFKIDDTYKYNPSYPKEYWDGYLTLAEFEEGGKYFIWTNFKPIKGQPLNGWFVALEGSWENDHSDDYLNVLLPVVERPKKSAFDIE